MSSRLVLGKFSVRTTKGPYSSSSCQTIRLRIPPVNGLFPLSTPTPVSSLFLTLSQHVVSWVRPTENRLTNRNLSSLTEWHDWEPWVRTTENSLTEGNLIFGKEIKVRTMWVRPTPRIHSPNVTLFSERGQSENHVGSEWRREEKGRKGERRERKERKKENKRRGERKVETCRQKEVK